MAGRRLTKQGTFSKRMSLANGFTSADRFPSCYCALYITIIKNLLPTYMEGMPYLWHSFYLVYNTTVFSPHILYSINILVFTDEANAH